MRMILQALAALAVGLAATACAGAPTPDEPQRTVVSLEGESCVKPESAVSAGIPAATPVTVEVELTGDLPAAEVTVIHAGTRHWLRAVAVWPCDEVNRKVAFPPGTELTQLEIARYFGADDGSRHTIDEQFTLPAIGTFSHAGETYRWGVLLGSEFLGRLPS